jgi:2-polyprenyl-6-methoxyphenol hydroxylase-like FAD-dependent oxidoreductase
MSARRAVVIGGSIGGLCTARVLSDHFDRVTIVDYDQLPHGAAHRKGVPQSRHPHVLLDRGRKEMSALFPGFEDAMKARGALNLDPELELAMLQPEGWAERRRSGHYMMFASRVLIESVIREIVEKQSHIEYLEATEVTGLVLTDGNDRRVSAVEVTNKQNGAASRIEADLVIDASGRSSRIPQWLEQLGFPAVNREIVDADAGYSTVWYKAAVPHEQSDRWWKGAFLNPASEAHASRLEDFYFGLLFPIEGDRWIVTVASWGGRPLPKDHESFAALLSRLRSPLLAEATAAADPISPVFYRRGMQNIWNHYETWSSGPIGFLATADAACAFNPVYGQGMTSAAVCAGILNDSLKNGDPMDAKFAPAFFKRQAEFLGQPWSLAVARDRQALGNAGDSSNAAQKQAADIFGRIMSEGRRYPEISDALFDVFNLNRTPESLMTDPKFLTVVSQILQSPPRPANAEPRQLSAHPPETIAA